MTWLVSLVDELQARWCATIQTSKQSQSTEATHTSTFIDWSEDFIQQCCLSKTQAITSRFAFGFGLARLPSVQSTHHDRPLICTWSLLASCSCSRDKSWPWPLTTSSTKSVLEVAKRWKQQLEGQLSIGSSSNTGNPSVISASTSFGSDCLSNNFYQLIVVIVIVIISWISC